MLDKYFFIKYAPKEFRILLKAFVWLTFIMIIIGYMNVADRRLLFSDFTIDINKLFTELFIRTVFIFSWWLIIYYFYTPIANKYKVFIIPYLLMIALPITMSLLMIVDPSN